jgi:hypothetical protein
LTFLGWYGKIFKELGNKERATCDR